MMKNIWIGLFLISLFVGCGSPDPILKTTPSRTSQVGPHEVEDSSTPSEHETEEKESKTWRRTGTHEVERR